MQETENAYAALAHRIQQAIDMDDLVDLKDCADLVELKRIHFMEMDEEANRKVIKPIAVYTAEHGSIEAMRFLLKEGADINAQDSYGNTPLLTAVDSNRIEMIRFLSQQPGIHPEIRNYYGESINSIALLNKDAVVIAYLKELEKPIVCDTVSVQLSAEAFPNMLTRH